MTCNNGWVSFISYNSPEFLERQMNELTKAGKIDFYWFAPHKGEIDETKNKRDKDHIHLYLHANGKFDSIKFQNFMKEIEPGKKIPRNCILPWKLKEKKEILDAELLYSYHNPAECKRRGEKKEFYYTPDIIITNNREQLDYMLQNAVVPYSPYDELEKTIKKGGSELELIKKGVFSYRDINYVKELKTRIKEDEQKIKSRFKNVLCRNCGCVYHQSEVVPESIEYRKDELLNIGICFRCHYIEEHPDVKMLEDEEL